MNASFLFIITMIILICYKDNSIQSDKIVNFITNLSIREKQIDAYKEITS